MEFFINNFSIKISEISKSELYLGEGVTVLKIESDTSLFKCNPTVIIADPFLFVHNNTLYLFYENQVKWYGRGRICMRKTVNLKDWSDEIEVLKEPFHLSFPYVFENDGKVYMMPETGHNGSIRLYEAIDDSLERWQLKTKLIDDGRDWVDSSLIKHEGIFYLFTSKKSDNGPYKQYLFFSNNFLGPYREHQKSPIFVGNDYGRNAGSVFLYKGNLFRPAQDCSMGYGDNVSLFKVEILSEDSYKEILYKKDLLERIGEYKEGGHQFSTVEFMGRRIVATDFKRRNYNIFEFCRRILKRL